MKGNNNNNNNNNKGGGNAEDEIFIDDKIFKIEVSRFPYNDGSTGGGNNTNNHVFGNNHKNKNDFWSY